MGLPKLLNQGGAELPKYAEAEGSLQSLMWSSPTEMLIAKGSSQNLVRSSTTRIVSHYMTSFLVLNHERVRYCNGLLKAKTMTIDDITLPVIASTICKNASTLRILGRKSIWNSSEFRNLSNSGPFDLRNFYQNFIFLIIKCVHANSEHISSRLESSPAIDSSNFMNQKTFPPSVFFWPAKKYLVVYLSRQTQQCLSCGCRYIS
jgi:hypothetical protein